MQFLLFIYRILKVDKSSNTEKFLFNFMFSSYSNKFDLLSSKKENFLSIMD